MKFASLVAFAAIAAAVSAAPLVHPAVHRTLRAQGTVNIFVTFKSSTEPALNAVQEASFATRGQKIASLVTALELHAKSSQNEVAALLAQEAAGGYFTKTQSFWLTNQIYIENATFELVEKLAALPSIAQITEEEILTLSPTVEANALVTNSTVVEWGVAKINANKVWATGNVGENAIVGAIDSGVRATHEALAANYRNDGFSWFDPETKAAQPYDSSGHGTHTMATIAGANGVGVAPGAKWMTCKGCRKSVCSQADVLACFQFMTCPTSADGAVQDCTKAPHLVSNSWGGGQSTTTFASAIAVWRKAGIIPIFLIGNEGPYCTTAISPGDNANVISVGATDNTDKVSSWSSKGPSVAGLVKPEVSAPGANIRSAWSTTDNSYMVDSGTSMATPHVAGAVALLIGAKPGLTFDEAFDALTKTANRTVKATVYACGNTSDSVWPNNQYGYGRIDVEAAVAYVKAL